MAYRCPECGYVFDEPYIYEESHGFTSGPYEKFSVCPNCYEPIGEDDTDYDD